MYSRGPNAPKRPQLERRNAKRCPFRQAKRVLDQPLREDPENRKTWKCGDTRQTAKSVPFGRKGRMHQGVTKPCRGQIPGSPLRCDPENLCDAVLRRRRRQSLPAIHRAGKPGQQRGKDDQKVQVRPQTCTSSPHRVASAIVLVQSGTSLDPLFPDRDHLPGLLTAAEAILCGLKRLVQSQGRAHFNVPKPVTARFYHFARFYPPVLRNLDQKLAMPCSRIALLNRSRQLPTDFLSAPLLHCLSLTVSCRVEMKSLLNDFTRLLV